LNQGLPLNRMGLILGGSPTDLLAGVPWEGVYHSSDQGQTWHATDDSLMNAQYSGALTAIGSRFIAGTFNGPFFTDNGGAQWHPSSSGFLMLSITALAAIDSNLYAATAHDGIFLSRDYGETWEPINNGLEKLEIYCFAVSGTDFYAGSYSNCLYHSTDKGASWKELNININDASVLTLAANGSVIAAGSRNGSIYRSADKGSSWTRINLGTTANINALALSGDALLAGSSQVFRSNDLGATWSVSGSGLPLQKAFMSFAVADDALYVGISPYGGIARSTDNGVTWTSVNNGLPGEAFIMSLVSTEKGIFALDNYKGVFLSMDHGASWKSIGSGLPTAGITTLLSSGGYLFAGSLMYHQGIWRRPLSELLTAVEPGSVDIPSEFSLEQNYPNPFNPSSTITYAVSSTEVVSLKVYDLLGREVATLVDGPQARGRHTVTFDASRLSAGMYVYQIRAGRYSAAKKMQLVK
jgi:photosystem II stability/assembly factor-like uncharacterized protein